MNRFCQYIDLYIKKQCASPYRKKGRAHCFFYRHFFCQSSQNPDFDYSFKTLLYKPSMHFYKRSSRFLHK